jgi:hypothetical protein
MTEKEILKNGKSYHQTQTSDIFDLTVSNNQRYQLLSNMDSSMQFETLKRLIDIYRISGVKKLEKFFFHVCIFDNKIDLYLKQDILYILSCKSTLKNKHLIKRSFSNSLFLMLKRAFDYEEYWIMFKETLILYNESYKDQTFYNFFKNIIILGFKKFRSLDTFKKIFSLIMFFKDEHYFIQLCVFIFDKYHLLLKIKNNLILLQIIFDEENEYKDYLFHIIYDKSIELNLKLEACDILYLKGSQNIKNKVQNILEKILPDIAYTHNSENVHLPSISTSVEKTLDSLLAANNGKKRPTNLYETLLLKFSNKDNVKGSLNRIFNYNFIKFSKHKLTLKEIFENVWLIIDSCDNELKHQLMIRLEEELSDMYDTCSMGYVTRLINIFSGFDINDYSNLGIKISYEDEIYAIFSSKINKIISDAPESIKDILLEELMTPSNNYENRLNLSRYLRPYLPKIWNEIFEIFKDELTVTDLDLYCRKVTMKYDGC